MGLADAFGAEDRVQVKFSTFYELVKGCTQRDGKYWIMCIYWYHLIYCRIL